MKKPDSYEKNKVRHQLTAREKILAAFHKLNPTYRVDGDKLNLILVIGDILSGPWPGMPERKQKNSRPARNLNTAEKEIDKVQATAKKFQNALNEMQVANCFLSEEACVHMQKLEEFLAVTIGEIDKAIKAIEKMKKDCPPLANRKSGRPENKGTLHVAEILADEFFRATGKLPTFSVCETPKGYETRGKFLDLVKSAFNALDIKASPEATARQANSLWRKRKSLVDAKYQSAFTGEAKEKNL